MKKIYSVLLVFAAVLPFVACSDETTNPYARESAITVQKSDLDFGALGGEAAVQLTAATPITVKSNVSWAVPTVDGTTVTVKCAENTNIEGRTGRLTIYSGSDSTQVSVHQTGLVLRVDGEQTFQLQNDAGSMLLDVVHTNAVEVSSDSPWLKATLTGNKLAITYDENTSGAPRTGTLTLKSGAQTRTISILQRSVSDLTYNNYVLFPMEWMITNQGTVYPVDMEIINGKMYMQFQLTDNATATVPVEVNPDTYAITIAPSKAAVGTIDTDQGKANIVYALASSKSVATTLNWESTAQLTAAPMEQATSSGTLKLWMFSGNSVGATTYDAIVFKASKANPYTQASDIISDIATIVAPVLMEMP